MKKLKCLVTAEIIAERFEESFHDILDICYAGYCLDHDVLPHEELIQMIEEYDILVSEYDTVSSDVFEVAKNLKFIVCCRGGVKDVVDIDEAMRRGIIVCNNAGRNAGAVTDMVMGFILDLTRNISLTSTLIHSKILTSDFSTKPSEYKDTVWGLDNNSPFIRYRGRSVNHLKLGIIGYGRVGRLLAEKAHAFGMDISAYDPYSDFDNKPDYVRIQTWEGILSESDIISVHCVLTPQTRDMFSKKEFDRMKNNSYFINTARGELVVEQDLADALNSGKLAGAALDVTGIEPIPADSILLGAKNLLLTPHIAGSSDDVQFCGTNMVIRSIRDYLNGKKPQNCVVYR